MKIWRVRESSSFCFGWMRRNETVFGFDCSTINPIHLSTFNSLYLDNHKGNSARPPPHSTLSAQSLPVTFHSKVAAITSQHFIN